MVWDPRIRSSTDPMMPRGVGHVKIDGNKHLVHTSDGPAGTMRWPGEAPGGPGGIIVHAPGSQEGSVRALTNEEVWGIQGGTREEWARRRGAGEAAGDLVREAVRALPP